MVSNSTEVFHSTAPDEDHRVLLEIVPDTWNIGRYLYSICKANTCDLSKGRVRFLRRNGPDASANSTFLRIRFEGGRLIFLNNLLAPKSY